MKCKKRKSNFHLPKVHFPHFRYYKKSGHPALIVGEQKTNSVEEYRYRKVMHGRKDGRHQNEEVVPNPKPKDPDPMYIGKRVRHDAKIYFDDKPLSWVYPNNKNNKKKK